MEEEPARRQKSRSLLARQKWKCITLPALVLFLFATAGFTILVCARTSLFLNDFLAPSLSQGSFQFTTPGADLTSTRLALLKYLVIDEKALVAVEGAKSAGNITLSNDEAQDVYIATSAGEREIALDIDEGTGEEGIIDSTSRLNTSSNTTMSEGSDTRQEFEDTLIVNGSQDTSVDTMIEGSAARLDFVDSIINGSKETTAATTSEGSDAEEEYEETDFLHSNRKDKFHVSDTQRVLHRMSASKRRLWLQRNWHTYQILQSDGLSDQFKTRMDQFLCGDDLHADKVNDNRAVAATPDGAVADNLPKENQGDSDRPHSGNVSAGQLPHRSLEVQDLAVNSESNTTSEGALLSSELLSDKSCRSLVAQSNCLDRFFMTWISPAASTFGVRERLALESVFKWHPSACVVILSRSLDTDDGKEILKPFLLKGYRVMAVAPDILSLFQDTPAERWFRKLRQGAQDPGDINLMQNLSNIMRLVALYKYGGTYLDTDIIVLKSMSGLRNAIGAQSMNKATGKWFRLNNALLVFDRKHPVVLKFIEEFANTFDGSKWGHNGPYLVSRVVNRIREDQSHQVSILPRPAFYPYSWTNIMYLFHAPGNDDEAKNQEAKLNILREQSYAIHLWNRNTASLQVEKGSIMEHLFKQSCIFCKAAQAARL